MKFNKKLFRTHWRIQQTLEKLKRKINDTFHIGLYWDTLRTIDKLEKTESIQEKVRITRALINKVKKIVYFDECTTTDENECKTWDDLQGWLSYFSDRWCMSRANRIVVFLEKVARENDYFYTS